VRDHPDVLFTKSDKENVTITINKSEYDRKMEEMLSDINTYLRISRDPTKKLTTDLRSLLYNWKKKNWIELHTYKRLLTTDGVLPRTYGLPKIHKIGNSLRIIISSLNSPLYHLAWFLHNIIKNSILEAPSTVKNSYHLVRKLNGTFFDPNYKLASLDVVSLFTNVPHEWVFENIAKKWDSISVNTKIPKEEFLLAIKLILNSTFFSFNKIIYKQIFGTPMGSPLSLIILDLVLQDLEQLAIS